MDEQTTGSMDQRLHNTEIKLAYLEVLLDELNEVVTAQQNRLDELDLLIRRLHEKGDKADEEKL